MGSWFSSILGGAAEGAATAGGPDAMAAASGSFDVDKLLGGINTAQNLSAGQGAVPKFGPPGLSGTQQPQLLDLQSLIMQKR